MLMRIDGIKSYCIEKEEVRFVGIALSRLCNCICNCLIIVNWILIWMMNSLLGFCLGCSPRLCTFHFSERFVKHHDEVGTFLSKVREFKIKMRLQEKTATKLKLKMLKGRKTKSAKACKRKRCYLWNEKKEKMEERKSHGVWGGKLVELFHLVPSFNDRYFHTQANPTIGLCWFMTWAPMITLPCDIMYIFYLSEWNGLF